MFVSRMATLLSLQVEEETDCLAVPCKSARDDGCKLKYRKFCLYVGKNFSSVRVTEHWHRLPEEVVESPSLEFFRRGLGTVMSHLLQLTELWVGWCTRWSPEFHSNFSCLQILWFLSVLSFFTFLLTISVFFLAAFSLPLCCKSMC